ncbi:MAG: hypothetical protein FRX49_09944 [Trebouxia sp. A1-2]|nr:MAG: hypothetical protein FRX49_09944 [Trebouxia sp. A1-2]
MAKARASDQRQHPYYKAGQQRLLAWQTLPLAVYSILNSKDISHDRLNSFSGSGMMDSIAFLTAGTKNSTCGNGDIIQRGLFGLMAHVPESCHSLGSFPRGRPPLVHGVGHIPHKLNLPHVLQEGWGDDAGGLPQLHGGWKGKV